MSGTTLGLLIYISGSVVTFVLTVLLNHRHFKGNDKVPFGFLILFTLVSWVGTLAIMIVFIMTFCSNDYSGESKIVKFLEGRK